MVEIHGLNNPSLDAETVGVVDVQNWPPGYDRSEKYSTSVTALWL